MVLKVLKALAQDLSRTQATDIGRNLPKSRQQAEEGCRPGCLKNFIIRTKRYKTQSLAELQVLQFSSGFGGVVRATRVSKTTTAARQCSVC